ncbi:MAG: FxsA family protein [Alphaproteobacteria bacterium]
MAIFLLAAFIIVPIVEIGLFIEIGARVGLWNTIALVVLTAVIGTWLLRAQGLETLRRAQESAMRNVFPVAELFDGLCLLVAGALLLTPGFLTDTLGFLLMAPPLRRLARDRLWRLISRGGGGRVWVNGEARARPADDADSGAIEGDYRIVDPDEPDPPDRDPKPPR